MGDPIGIALGVAGLAGLFGTCVQCFDLIQLGAAFARDYEIVQTKFEAQKIRFLIWGQVVGLTESGTFDDRLELPFIRPTVCRILNCMQLLFSDAGGLSKRYGLRQSQGIVISPELHGGGVFREAYLKFQAKLAKDQRDANILTKGRWAIADKAKFAALVQDLKDFIDNLEDITKSFQSLEQQRHMITTEIDSISDAHSLRLLQLACSENSDPISDAASQRLLQLENGSTRDSHSNALASRMGSLSIEGSYHTAPSHNAGITGGSADIVFEGPVSTDVPQNQRVVSQCLRQISTRSGGTGSSTKSQRQGSFSSVGLALRNIKLADESHTSQVLAHHALSTSPNEKRMLLILNNLLQSSPTPFVSLAPIEDDLFDLLGSVEGPPGSPYQGGIFYVRITIPYDFPWVPPECRFLTKIYHPNIDPRGKICLDVLEQENWRFELMYLESLLLSICSLLDEPGVEDPLVPEIASLYLNDKAAYDEIARDYTRKYATGTRPQLALKEQVAVPTSWSSSFLRQRLEETREKAASIIQALHGQMSKTIPQEPGPGQIQPQPVLDAMYQLSSGLTTLYQKFTSSDASRILPEKADDMENFFDLCSTSFHDLTNNEAWREHFPHMPTFTNDLTRGTGSSYTYTWARNEEDRILDMKADWTPMLEHIVAMVKHCQWMNGEISAIARHPNVRDIFFRGRPGFSAPPGYWY